MWYISWIELGDIYLMSEHIMERLYDVDIVERIVYLTIIFTVTQLFLRGIEYEETSLIPGDW